MKAAASGEKLKWTAMMPAALFVGATPIEKRLIGKRSAYKAWSPVGYYVIEPEVVNGALGYYISLQPTDWSSGSFDPTAPREPRGIRFESADAAKRWVQKDVGPRTTQWLAEAKERERLNEARVKRAERRSRSRW